jgi:glutathione S-transferase
VLQEKGIAFERIDVDLRDKPEWFLVMSPMGKVPLLQLVHDNGRQATRCLTASHG